MNFENHHAGKVVVVTGASSRLGESIARAFARQESIVYIVARNISKLVSISDELQTYEQQVIPICLDVTDCRQVEDLAKRVMQEQGRLDVWVNNAGTDKKMSLEELTPEVLTEITAVNYFGLVYGTREAARQMKMKQDGGDIVQILSTSAFTPRIDEFSYCGAKAAAAIFSECAQQELKPYGIRVIPFFPGGMDTPFFEKAGLQLPKNAMDPREIAEIVLHAVSLPKNIILAQRIYRNG